MVHTPTTQPVVVSVGPSPVSKALVVEAISIIQTKVGFSVLGNLAQLVLTMSMSSNTVFPQCRISTVCQLRELRNLRSDLS